MTYLVLEIVRTRRGYAEVLADILDVANQDLGVTKTTIVYKANINFTNFETYFDFLECRDLIEKIHIDNGQIRYGTTDKGKDFLKRYNYFKNLI